MTLDIVERILRSERIIYSFCDYENEEEFLKHIYLFPDLSNPDPYKVRSLIIKSNNGYKDIELQFNFMDGVYVFVEMLFGEFGFEMADCEDEYFAEALLDNLFAIFNEQVAILVRNNLTKKKWIGDSLFALDEDDPVVGEPAFFRAIERIQAPKTFLEQRRKTQIQYEIYTFSSYQCVIK